MANNKPKAKKSSQETAKLAALGASYKGPVPSTPPGASRSIYFSDGEKLNELNRLLANYPRTTLSSVLNQFIGPTIEGIKKVPANTREVEIIARIWL